jgi:7-cyano-7-deazaguanine reductase
MTLTQLGHRTPPPESPDAAVLEAVPNPHPGLLYVVRFTCPEFTSICPVTGQPDFAHLVIDYAPEAAILEIKSLKLYLGAFRNHGAFHEDCTLAIARRLIDAPCSQVVAHRRLLVTARRHPDRRLLSNHEPPAGLWIPDPGVAPYRGRG